MKNIFIVAKKELRAYFNNPTAYIVVVAFLLLWEFLFFRNVFLIGEVSLNTLFEYLPWIFLLIIPALTMGSLAEEKSEGTLEFLLTHPLSQAELVIGKFLGILSFVALSLLFVFPLAWSFSRFGALDWGKVFSQYLASVFLVSVLASLGIWISSLFASQISAFLLSAIASFFLVIVGTEFFSNHFPLELSSFLEQLSVSNHFESMTRGVIDARDVWYFVSLSAVFLSLTYLNLVKNKYGNRKSAYRQYQIGAALLLGIVILSNIVGTKIPGRLDLTQEKIYTLSPATKKIVSELPDIVNISLYASDKLPAQLQPVLRETKDVLEDYRKNSGGKIKVSYKNPSTDSEAASTAAAQGIQPVRFNVVSQEEFQVKDGYLGIAIAYGGKNEAVPFVQNINDLEYQLSSLIRQLTVDQKPKIGFLSGHGEKSLYTDYNLLNTELKKQFEIVTITGQSEEKKDSQKTTPKKTEEPTTAPKKFSIPEDVKTVIIASPTENYSDSEKNTLTDFLNKGGNLLFLADGAIVSPQTLSASVSQNNLLDYIKEQTGVEVEKNLVYDLRSNESVAFGGGQMRYILPYPFWARALRGADNSPITSKIDSVTLPWASSLKIDENSLKEKSWQKTELLTTSDYAGSETSTLNIDPNQKLSAQNLDRKLLAVALSSTSNKGRIIILGDADFLSDQNMKDNSGNFGFGFEAISWLSQESVLSQIKVRNLAERKFVFDNQGEPSVLKFGNMAFALITVSGYGSWRLWRRRRMKNEIYPN
jgi:ABC-2 type transport system permease protein